MRLVAAIEHPAIVHRILAQFGFPTRTPWRPQSGLALEPGVDEYDGIDAPALAE